MANLLIRPGSILIILIIGAVLLGMFGWAENSLDKSREESFKKQNQAISCSNTKVDFIDQRIEGENYTVYLQTNRPVEALMVQFKGSRNATRIVENVDTNSVVSVSARMDSVSEVKARVQGCNRVFG